MKKKKVQEGQGRGGGEGGGALAQARPKCQLAKGGLFRHKGSCELADLKAHVGALQLSGAT